jgi:hypothetical protein
MERDEMTSRKQEGFRVTKRTAIIDFGNLSPWHGVEATVVISVPFETLFWYQRNAGNTEASISVEAIKRFGDDFLIEWNVLDPDGAPYPATGDGVAAVTDSSLITELMKGWIDAVVQPPENLSGKSNGSGMSEAQLTEELASLSTSPGN